MNMGSLDMFVAPLCVIPEALIWYVILDWSRLKKSVVGYAIFYVLGWIQAFVWPLIGMEVVQGSVVVKGFVYVIGAFVWWFIVLRKAPLPSRLNKKPGLVGRD